MKRRLFNVALVLSLLLFVGVCVLWVRGRSGADEAEWRYDRYLADRSAASNRVALTFDRRLWVNVSWGRVGPYNGRLVWGYYVNATRSGGRPRLTFRHDPDTPPPIGLAGNISDGTSGWGPLRWQNFRHSTPSEGEHGRYLRLGVSHWLAALLLLVLPLLWLILSRLAARRARIRGFAVEQRNSN